VTARKEFLLSLYRKMLLIRLVEEAIADRYHEQEMRCPVHLSIGQEGAASGACQHLLATDVVSSAHRSHAHYLAKGGSVRAMLAELYGKAAGCAGGRGGSMHLLDLDAGVLPCLPIIGTSISTGVGAAFSFKQRKQNSVSMIFMGDAAVEEGIFHEAANFSSIKSLPVVFVCENNFYSVCTPLEVRQPQRPITELAQAHELHTAHADGNDGLAVQAIAKDAIDLARNGEGPSFLLLDTYRMREHCGPMFDQETGYRTDEEYNEWLEKCPIMRHFSILKNEINWTTVDDKAFCQAIRDEIDAAFNFAINAPFPAQETAGLHVYAK
jgi:TPP-dependent pyruvate/acetoin dehydrogenase alpha subunit